MLKIVKGNVTEPIDEGKKCIVHVCNNIGAWGSGVVVAISKRWPEPEKAYRQIAEHFPEEMVLGSYQMVMVEDDITVVNMIAQHGIRTKKNRNDPPPIRYDALRECLRKVANELPTDISIHMPRIGCGRAGGTWDVVGPIVEEELVEKGFDVVVYDFEEKEKKYSQRK